MNEQVRFIPLPIVTNECPLASRWCRWTVYAIAGGRHLTVEEREALRHARSRGTRWSPTACLPVDWEVGAGDEERLPTVQGLIGKRRHLHASVGVGRRILHIDCVRGAGFGPGFSFAMVRLSLDGRLVDEQVHGGSSLGFTLWGGVALGGIDVERAVGVSPWRFSAGEAPLVWLMRRIR